MQPNKITPKILCLPEGKFWTTWKKIAFTIILAVITWALFGCNSDRPDIKISEPAVFGETDIPFLKQYYAAYNDAYFQGKLPKDTRFSLELGDANMADTDCNKNGEDCMIRFNMRYSRAQRNASSSLIHEMCHIRSWKQNLIENKPPMMDNQQYYHSGAWQACMLQMDEQGAFRLINIDNYRGR